MYYVIAVPLCENSLTRVFRRLHADFARAVNFRLRRTGHLWQSRFYSCAMAEAHTFQALAYVEQNPLRAGLVERAEEYAWSSARAHVAGDDLGGMLELTQWRKWYTPERWNEVLSTSVRGEAWEERFREATLNGRPFGSEEHVAWVAELKKEILKRKGPGRPAKAETKALRAG